MYSSEHYDPKDPYLQKLISDAMRKLREAYEISTNGEETCWDICKKLQKELPIEATPRYGDII